MEAFERIEWRQRIERVIAELKGVDCMLGTAAVFPCHEALRGLGGEAPVRTGWSDPL